MPKRFLLSSLSLLVFGICTAPAVSADPVTITSGTVTMDFGEGGFFLLRGAGFEIRGGTAPRSFFPLLRMSPQHMCFRGCSIGTTVNLSTNFGSDPDAAYVLGGTIVGPKSGTIDGVFYPELMVAGLLRFVAPSIVLPPPDLRNLPFSISFVATEPFVLDGELSAFVPGQPGTPVFQRPLMGQGEARVKFGWSPISQGGSETYGRVTAEYTFADPVPEPASMLLLGTGLTALMVRRRRR